TALAALTRARDTFAERGQALEAAKCEADMADAYRELNLHPEAQGAYERAIGQFEALSIGYERARAEWGRAGVLLNSGQLEQAAIGLERAATLFRAQKNRLRQAVVQLTRAHLFRRQGQTEEARQEAQQAAGRLSRVGSRAWAAEARFLLAEMAF